MHIKSVHLRDIRGFKDLRFDFTRDDGNCAGWTVITGDNGSGKSTLLKALAIALVGRDTAQKLQPSFHRWLRDGCETADIEIEVIGHSAEDGLKEGGRPPKQSFPVRLGLRRAGKEPALEELPPRGKTKTYRTPQRTLWSTESAGWFSCGYGPFRRVFGASSEATRQMVAPGPDRFVTMFQEAASLGEVDVWLRNLHHKSLEKKPAEMAQLALLEQFLRDELLPDAITVDRVNSDGLLLRDRNGVELSWGEMSDGYRAALALMADILRHLIDTFGHVGLLQDSIDGRPCMRHHGVVLIDEVDAHLHPSWQRKIGFWLKGHFPNMQFIVTSHSPLICQAADPQGLFMLPSPGSDDGPRQLTTKEYQEVVTGRADTVLRSPAFGLENTRSPKAVESRAELARLNAKVRAGAKLSAEDKLRQGELKFFDSVDEGV